ncbi:MAG: hypothetical protein A4E65_00803 [Syntrophorhabdus sp. PtaU1.Bin153]|nr:MAG: hypothetical protein A4E65_00803 [Syntrophorhabdus sp. PtaU1.Bin153]
MITKAKIGDNITAQVIRNIKDFNPKFMVRSVWDWECRDKYGNLKWMDKRHNVCTAEGLNALLNIMFHGSTQITTWYVAIFETDTTPSDTTTYATPVYTECTAYDEANRPEFVEAAASSKMLSNSASPALFTINATKTIYGGALLGGGSAASTKGNTAGGGTLFCASKLPFARSCVDDDVIKIIISLTAADT